jgi:hypothetical protein
MNRVVQLVPRAGSLRRAQELYASAEFNSCLGELQNIPGIEALVLRMRALLRTDRVEAVGEVIDTSQRVVLASNDNAMRAMFWMLAATAYHRMNDRARMYAAFSAARGYAFCLDNTDVLGELAYYEAMVAWSDGALDEAERLIAPAFAANSCSIRAYAHALAGVTASARKNVEAQLGHIEDAWLTLAEDIESNQYQAAHTIFASVALAVELGRCTVARQAAERMRLVRWNDDLSYLRFQILRNLANNEALRGDHLAAFRLWRESAQYAPSPAWKLTALVERTCLAIEMSEDIMAREDLATARALADGIDWDATSGDERNELLALAEVTSAVNIEEGVRILRRFKELQTKISPLSLYQENNPERVALESFYEGVILLRAGETARGTVLLKTAFDIYRDFGFIRRASQAAVHLAHAGAGGEFAAYARSHAAKFPNSWIVRQIASIPAVAPGEGRT